MEFFDEESRPRFLLHSQSRSTTKPTSHSETIHKPTLFISLSLSALLLTLSLFYFSTDPLHSIFLWFSLSLLMGPFAPTSLTAGDIRVGLGPSLPPPQSPLHSSDPPKRSRNFKPHPNPDHDFTSTFSAATTVNTNRTVLNEKEVVEEAEWSVADMEVLKKQVAKHPVGMPGRWEAVAGAFGGRHKVESVVKMAKAMGERKLSDADSYARFLKDRKAVDRRVVEVVEKERGESVGSWSSGEDIALLNALKAFPKDVGMRWEKVSAAVPGRSKAACMKRVAELKKDFRSSKGGGSGQA